MKLTLLGLIAIVVIGTTWFVSNDLQEKNASLARQMTALQSSVIAQGKLGASGNEVPTVVALFSTSLATQISSSATSMTLTSAADKAGNNLASSTYPFIIDEGTASEEMVIADCTSTACTNMIRGIDPVSGTTTVSALKKTHRRGASVKITDGPQLMILSRMANGIGQYPSILTYASGITSSSFTANNQIINKAYADLVGSSGCANGSETARGCVELATQLEMGSSTNLGSTGASLVLQSQYATSSPSAVCGVCVVVTQASGKILQSFLDLTKTFAWSGLHTFSAGFLATASSTFTTATTSFNGVSYGFPASQGAATTTPFNNGSGTLSWLRPDMTLVGTTTITSAVATTTFAVASAGTDLLISIEIPSLSAPSDIHLQFNADTAGNYGSVVSEIPAATQSQSSKGAIRLTGDSTAGANGVSCFVTITDTIAQRKLATWTCGTLGSGAAAGQIHLGSGVWNNTTARISSISVGAGLAGATMAAGTRISVYSSQN